MATNSTGTQKNVKRKKKKSKKSSRRILLFIIEILLTFDNEKCKIVNGLFRPIVAPVQLLLKRRN